MGKTVQHAVTFRAPPARLFELYMDAKKHSAAIGAPAVLSRKVGGRWSAYGGQLQGRMLAIVPRRMIVQSWRGEDWKRSELDSILVLVFDRAPGGGRVSLVHANIPDRYCAGIRRGWHEYYWKRWKAYLAR